MNVIYHHINLFVRVLLAVCTIKACLSYSLVLRRNKELQNSSSFKFSYLWVLVLFSVAQNGVVSANVGLRLHEPDSVVNQLTALKTAQDTAEITVDLPSHSFVLGKKRVITFPKKILFPWLPLPKLPL